MLYGNTEEKKKVIGYVDNIFGVNLVVNRTALDCTMCACATKENEKDPVGSILPRADKNVDVQAHAFTGLV